MEQLYSLTASQLLDLLYSKTITPVDILESIFKRIDSVDNRIKGFVFLDRQKAIDAAKKLLDKKQKGILYGIPVVIKDNICVKDEPTTCASFILENFKPPYNATVIEKLKSHDAVLLGKSNMDEFAFGSSCETSCYGPTHNPWDTKRIPGGSSGGSAAIIASHQGILALGSDTGGSIRQPASLCGVAGLKPTYGRVSRYGLIAFASSLDQIGPITKDVYDAALLMNAIAGYDAMDSTSVDIPTPDYTKSLIDNVKGLRFGIPKEYFVEGIDTEVKNSVLEAVDILKKMGADCKQISLPHTEFAVSVYYILATSEASSNLARFDGVQYGLRKTGSDILEMYEQTRGAGFGQEAKRRIILGTYSLSSGYYDAYYLKAQKVRTLIINDFKDVFDSGIDCVLTPTSPTPAFGIGEKIDDPLSMYLSDIFTIPVNLAGLPAISIPCGFSKGRLPVGLQLIGSPFGEEIILRVAYAYQQNTDFHKKKPNL